MFWIDIFSTLIIRFSDVQAKPMHKTMTAPDVVANGRMQDGAAAAEAEAVACCRAIPDGAKARRWPLGCPLQPGEARQVV